MSLDWVFPFLCFPFTFPWLGFTFTGFPWLGFPFTEVSLDWVPALSLNWLGFPFSGCPLTGFSVHWGVPWLGFPFTGVSLDWVFPSLGFPFTFPWLGFPFAGFPWLGFPFTGCPLTRFSIHWGVPSLGSWVLPWLGFPWGVPWLSFPSLGFPLTFPWWGFLSLGSLDWVFLSLGSFVTGLYVGWNLPFIGLPWLRKTYFRGVSLDWVYVGFAGICLTGLSVNHSVMVPQTSSAVLHWFFVGWNLLFFELFPWFIFPQQRKLINGVFSPE